MKFEINKMKKKTIFSTITLALFLFLSGNISYAQGDGKAKHNKLAKINELRKKFLTEKLALTATEQAQFFPLLDEYKAKEKNLRDSFRKKYKPNEIPYYDDKKAEEYFEAMIKLKNDQNNLFKEYLIKFKKVLPIKKVIMLPEAEKEFKKAILKRAINKGKTPPPPAPEDE